MTPHAPEPLQESMGRQGLLPPIKDAGALHVRLMRDLDEQQLQRWRSEFGAFFRKR